MTKQHKFIHPFEEDSESPQMFTETDATGKQAIRVNVEENGNVWLSANCEGWLHLARICAELGTRDFEPLYHFHMTFDFQGSDGSGQEITFEVAEK